MNHLDSKQSKIITSWIELAESKETDPYLSFISMWIAFNAFCCAGFAHDANKLRPQLGRQEGLSAMVEGEVNTSGTIRFKNAKYRIRLDQPRRIDLDISERYTEDLVFESFVRLYRDAFEEHARIDPLRSELGHLLAAIRKPDGHHYVVNMAKAKDYFDTVEVKGCLGSDDVRRMINQNVIVAVVNESNLAEIKNLLYQVRCNIFHGEKAPGVLNDDRIASAAYPVLKRIVKDIVNVPKTMA